MLNFLHINRFNFLHIHLFNFLRIQPYTPAHGRAGPPAEPAPLLRRRSAAGWVEHRRASLGWFGRCFSCLSVFLRGVCLFVGGDFVQPFAKFVKKEMRRKCVRARGWVRIGARRAETQRGVW